MLSDVAVAAEAMPLMMVTTEYSRFLFVVQRLSATCAEQHSPGTRELPNMRA